MIRSMTCRGWLGYFGLVCLSLTGNAQAWERPPVRVNTKVEFHFDVKVGPDFRRPTAPWYAYFPVDPRLSPSPQTSPYPPWLASIPPASLPPVAAKDTQRPSANMVVPITALSQPWLSPGSHGTNLQPVSYVPTQVPSYWYPR